MAVRAGKAHRPLRKVDPFRSLAWASGQYAALAVTHCEWALGGPENGEAPMSRAIILSSVRWNFLWQRHHSVALSLRHLGYDVTWVDPHLRNLRQVLSRGAGRARPNIVENPPFPGRHLSGPSPAAYVHPRAWARRMYSSLGSFDLVLSFLPSRAFFEFVELGHGVHVYDRVIDWLHAPPAWRPSRWPTIEAAWFSRNGTRVTTDSPAMAEELSAQGTSAVVVPPAPDRAFTMRQWSEPSSMNVGYFGAIGDWVDVPFLARLASAVPVEVIGPVSSPDLRQRLVDAGVYVHRPVPQAALLESIEGWGGCILPYRGSRSSTLVPAKLYNAVASRRPTFVRGIDLPRELRGYVTSLPRDDAAALDLILNELGRRVPDFQLPTWDDRVLSLLGNLDKDFRQ